MRYQIYEAKSVKYDAQQRVGVTLGTFLDRYNIIMFLNFRENILM